MIISAFCLTFLTFATVFVMHKSPPVIYSKKTGDHDGLHIQLPRICLTSVWFMAINIKLFDFYAFFLQFLPPSSSIFTILGASILHKCMLSIGNYCNLAVKADTMDEYPEKSSKTGTKERILAIF